MASYFSIIGSFIWQMLGSADISGRLCIFWYVLACLAAYARASNEHFSKQMSCCVRMFDSLSRWERNNIYVVTVLGNVRGTVVATTVKIFKCISSGGIELKVDFDFLAHPHFFSI